jgi:hypothetical protein
MKPKKAFLSHAGEQKRNFVSWVVKCLIENETKPALTELDIFFDDNMKIGQDGEFEFWNVILISFFFLSFFFLSFFLSFFFFFFLNIQILNVFYFESYFFCLLKDIGKWHIMLQQVKLFK